MIANYIGVICHERTILTNKKYDQNELSRTTFCHYIDIRLHIIGYFIVACPLSNLKLVMIKNKIRFLSDHFQFWFIDKSDLLISEALIQGVPLSMGIK